MFSLSLKCNDRRRITNLKYNSQFHFERQSTMSIHRNDSNTLVFHQCIIMCHILCISLSHLPILLMHFSYSRCYFWVVGVKYMFIAYNSLGKKLLRSTQCLFCPQWNLISRLILFSFFEDVVNKVQLVTNQINTCHKKVCIIFINQPPHLKSFV